MRSKVGPNAFDTHCPYPKRWVHMLVRFLVPFCGPLFRSARRSVLARLVHLHFTSDHEAITYIQPMSVYRVCRKGRGHMQPTPCIPRPREHSSLGYLARQSACVWRRIAHSDLGWLLMELPQKTSRRSPVLFMHNEHTYSANIMSRHAPFGMYMQHECPVLQDPSAHGQSLPGTQVHWPHCQASCCRSFMDPTLRLALCLDSHSSLLYRGGVQTHRVVRDLHVIFLAAHHNVIQE